MLDSESCTSFCKSYLHACSEGNYIADDKGNNLLLYKNSGYWNWCFNSAPNWKEAHVQGGVFHNVLAEF